MIEEKQLAWLKTKSLRELTDLRTEALRKLETTTEFLTDIAKAIEAKLEEGRNGLVFFDPRLHRK